MPKLTRKTQQIFANNSGAQEVTQFGTAKDPNAAVYTKDPAVIMSGNAYGLGWDSAVTSDDAPFMEDRNAVDLATSYQLAYNFQEGIAEYDAGTTYYVGSIVKTLNDNNTPTLYYSLTDDNTGNALTDTSNWAALKLGGGGGLPLLASFWSETPIDDRNVHIKDGSLIDGTIYSGAFNKLKALQNTNPNLFTTESDYQAKVQATGECGQYVLNANSFRIPTQISFMQGTLDKTELGSVVEAGLPNITGSYTGLRTGNSGNPDATGALKMLSDYVSALGSGSGATNRVQTLGLDASDSNPIYGKSSTVQPQAIKGYYYLVLSTGIEEEVNIKETLTTINPFSLFESKYSANTLNNPSWVVGGSTWTKTMYTSQYEALEVEQNSSIAVGTVVTLPSGGSYAKQGVSVKLSTEEVTDYDWVIDTANQTFKLPLLDGTEDLPSDKYENLELGASGTPYYAPANGFYALAKDATAVGQYVGLIVKKENSDEAYYGDWADRATNNGTVSVAVYVKKGMRVDYLSDLGGQTRYFRFIYAKGNGSLYFYLGETATGINEVNIGALMENVGNKTTAVQAVHSAMPSDRYIDFTPLASGSTYTAPADGYICVIVAPQSAATSVEIISAPYGQSVAYSNNSGIYPAITMPIKKGKQFIMYHVAVASWDVFRFVYAEGAE